MRKTYIKPEMNSEKFITNEYIAVCWDLRCYTPLCKYNDYNNRIGGIYEDTDEGLNKCVKDYDKSNIIHEAGDTDYETEGKYYHIGRFLSLHHELTITKHGDGTTANAS